jgi:hypothetical protein
VPDLHGWIGQQIDRVENDLRAVDKEHGRSWTTRWNASSDTFTIYDGNSSAVAADVLPAAAGLIALNDPATVLRRCAADRKILARHRLSPDAYWADAATCEGCGTEGEMGYAVTENLNDCPELLDLGHAHGLTPEILAGLDRPQEGERPEPSGPSLIPDALAEAFAAGMLRAMTTRIIAANTPSPKEKAIKILAPELKKIPGYVPTSNPEA